jgi:2-keto-3-deoxy-L-rhamnonate aldolase RhmA
MRKNKFREFLNSGKATVGTHMDEVSPSIAEVIGYSGAFDYIELVGEYADWDLKDLANFSRAVDLFPHMSSMMKVEQEPRIFIASRSIDAGIESVLFTDCRSAEEARACIRAVKAESPESGGIHGCGMRRNVGYVVEPCSQAWVDAMDDVVIALMIEKAGAMEQIDEILSIKGLDMVQFGPGDYSINIGKAGKGRDPDVQKAQRDMIEKALKKGIHPRVEIGSFEQAKPWIEMGVRHFCVGWDLRIIYDWCKTNGEGLKKLLS